MAVNQSAYQLLMGGLRNMFQPPQPAANASIYDLARADAQRQALGGLGAGLVAAAVPQTKLMRAQALQQAFGGMGNMGTNVYNAAQARLMAQRAETEAAQQAAQNRFFAQGGVAGAPVSVRDGGFAAGIAPVSMPGATQFPGGLSAQDWNAVTSIGNVNPESGMSFFTSLVEQRNKEKEGGFEGSKNLEGVFDSKGNFFRAYVRTDGSIQRPEGAVGELRFASPQEINAQKAQGTEIGKSTGAAISDAPTKVTNAIRARSVIADILDPKNRAALTEVTGSLEGSLPPGFALETLSPFTSGENDMALKIENLQSNITVEGIEAFRGTGAFTEKEGQVAATLTANINRIRDTDQFVAELQRLDEILAAAEQRQRLIEGGVDPAEARKQIEISGTASGNVTSGGTQAPSISNDDPLGIR
jgi:hypothetical protein